MTNVFQIEDLDTLNARKIHELTRTEGDTIKFLQDINLLPKVPQDADQCRNNCNDWKLEKRPIIADGSGGFTLYK